MARIVAGMFEHRAAADAAVERIRALGIGGQDITSFVVNPPGMHHGLPLGGDEAADPGAEGGGKGAAIGAAVGTVAGTAIGAAAAPLVGPAGIAAGLATGALIGSIAGATRSMGQDEPAADKPTARPGGVMVAVHAATTDTQPIVAAMRDAGSKLVEMADGDWRDGQWKDFDPVRAPTEVAYLAGNPDYPT